MSDSTYYTTKEYQKGAWLPFYLGGSVGIPVNYKTLDGNIFNSVSAGIYLGRVERSSLILEIGNYEKQLHFWTAGFSLAFFKKDRSIISPEIMGGLFGGAGGHQSGGLIYIAAVKYLYRVDDIFSVTATLKYSPVSLSKSRFIFFNLGIQLN